MSTAESVSQVQGGEGINLQEAVSEETDQPQLQVDEKMETATTPDQVADDEQGKRLSEDEPLQQEGIASTDAEPIRDDAGGSDGSREVQALDQEGETTEHGAMVRRHSNGSDCEMQEGSFQEGYSHGEEYHTEEEVGSEDNMDQRDDGTIDGASDKLQTMVNEVLDKKMEGFQSQMLQMLAMIQNVATKSMPEEPSPKDPKLQAGKNSDQKAKSVSSDDMPKKADGPDKLAAQKAREERVELRRIEQRKFGQFLKTISGVLDMPVPAAHKEQSFLDGTVTVDDDQWLENLPVEGLVKNSWQKVTGKNLQDGTMPSAIEKYSYPWGMDDMLAYGEIAELNDGMKKFRNRGKKNRAGKESSTRSEPEVKRMESLFRYQQRIMSYASYFLAALGRSVNGEGEESPSKDTIAEIMKRLSQCLLDTCDASTQGCIAATKVRRRMYLDALQVQTTREHYEAVNLPLSKKLFPDDLDKFLEERGVKNFGKPVTDGGAPAQQKGPAKTQPSPRGGQQGLGNRGKGNQGKGNQWGRGRGNSRPNQGGGGQGRQQQSGQRGNQGQGGRGQGPNDQRRGPQQQSGGKRSRSRNNERRASGGGRQEDRGRDVQGREGQGRRLSDGLEADLKRRRPLGGDSMLDSRQDARLDSRRSDPEDRMRSPLSFSDASFNVGRLTMDRGSSGQLFDYDSLLDGPGHSSSSSSLQAPSLGGGYYRPGMSPSLLASIAPLNPRPQRHNDDF